MNFNCFIVLLVSIGATVCTTAVNYKEVAKEVFGNFSIGPVPVGHAWHFVPNFTFQDQEYELNITNSVIRRFDSTRYYFMARNGHPLPTPGQHSMQIIFVLATQVIDSEMMYKKKKSNESPKELSMLSLTESKNPLSRAIDMVINFDMNERKVLGYDRVYTPTTVFETTTNCRDEAPGFCHALHKYLNSSLNYATIAQEMEREVEKQLTARRY